MKCPTCGQEMEEGVVQSAREIFFAIEPHRFWFKVKKEEVLLSSPQLDPPDLCRIPFAALQKGGHQLCGEDQIKPTSANHSKRACPEGRALGVSGQNER